MTNSRGEERARFQSLLLSWRIVPWDCRESRSTSGSKTVIGSRVHPSPVSSSSESVSRLFLAGKHLDAMIHRFDYTTHNQAHLYVFFKFCQANQEILARNDICITLFFFFNDLRRLISKSRRKSCKCILFFSSSFPFFLFLNGFKERRTTAASNSPTVILSSFFLRPLNPLLFDFKGIAFDLVYNILRDSILVIAFEYHRVLVHVVLSFDSRELGRPHKHMLDALCCRGRVSRMNMHTHARVYIPVRRNRD